MNEGKSEMRKEIKGKKTSFLSFSSSVLFQNKSIITNYIFTLVTEKTVAQKEKRKESIYLYLIYINATVTIPW
jgi:hypothetical protein